MISFFFLNNSLGSWSGSLNDWSRLANKDINILNVIYTAGRRYTTPMVWMASDPGIMKLKKENERLKKMLAESELEVSILQEAY